MIVEKVPNGTPKSLDQWYQELEAMVAENDPEDIARLEATLKEADELAKAQFRSA